MVRYAILCAVVWSSACACAGELLYCRCTPDVVCSTCTGCRWGDGEGGSDVVGEKRAATVDACCR